MDPCCLSPLNITTSADGAAFEAILIALGNYSSVDGGNADRSVFEARVVGKVASGPVLRMIN
jgi:hypothetical protein